MRCFLQDRVGQDILHNGNSYEQMHENCPHKCKAHYYLLTESMKLHWASGQKQVVQRLEQSKDDEERCRKRKAITWCKSCVEQKVCT